MIQKYISYLLSLESKGIKLGLDRTNKLFKICQNPQKNFPSIQVIGTNGKGSTSAIIANILKAANYKVGLYTSPHLLKINERIRINGRSIKDNEIINFINNYKSSINQLGASFFETMTALAVWYFAKEKVDIAILETGLGGRLDSVTACDSQLLLCTSISKDHEHILGDTIEEIAYEKICALKNNMLCLSLNHRQSIKNIFNTYAKSINATIKYIDSNYDNYHLNLNGDHQLENKNLAISAIKHLNEFKVKDHCIQKGLSSVLWPGRIQKIYNEPNIYYDVAHNHDSFNYLCQYIQQLSGQKILILALQKHKNIIGIINKIESTFDVIIVTQTNIRNYMPAESLAQLFSNQKINIISNPVKAIKLYTQYAPNINIVIAGSHYLGPIISKEFKISFENI